MKLLRLCYIICITMCVAGCAKEVIHTNSVVSTVQPHPLSTPVYWDTVIFGSGTNLYSVNLPMVLDTPSGITIISTVAQTGNPGRIDDLEFSGLQVQSSTSFLPLRVDTALSYDVLPAQIHLFVGNWVVGAVYSEISQNPIQDTIYLHLIFKYEN